MFSAAMKLFGGSLVLCIVPLLLASANAQPIAAEDVPESLRPWIKWVLHKEQTLQCPFLYDSHKQRRCAWPSRLELKLDNREGTFVHDWAVFRESWITLPGNTRIWPQEITVDDKSALVTEHQGRPTVKLGPGHFRVSGRFHWDKLPEGLPIPPDTGLINLEVNGVPIGSPKLNPDGLLWLQEKPAAKTAPGTDRITLSVFRKISDANPLVIVTRIDIQAAGEQRELLLGKALLDEFIPLRLSSPLPARLETDGNIRVQVRPGNWALVLDARHPAELTEITLHPAHGQWPKDEVWVFEAHNELRLVEITGPKALDPQQTALPKEWQHLPAFLMASGQTLRFRVIRRGDPEPEPDDLTITRDLWLDFDGGGYTIKDSISANMTRSWRLNVTPEIDLGRVLVDGTPQLITQVETDGPQGVEVRRGNMQLDAESRHTGARSSLNAVGWQHEFRQAAATLHLPPGWRLLWVNGVDNIPDTWLHRWTLLDLFMVLISSLAVARLWHWRWGIISLLTLSLIWHEAHSPHYIWLNILATLALLRVLPSGRFRGLVSTYRNLSFVVLIVTVIPFMVSQARTGLYPQLEPVAPAMPGTSMMPQPEAVVPEEASVSMALEQRVAPGPALERRTPDSPPDSLQHQASANFSVIDPNANVQTGPGLPQWRWHEVSLSWNGPVSQDQQIELVLIPPSLSTLLHFLRIGFVACLTALLLLSAFANVARPGPATAVLLLVLPLVNLLGPGAAEVRAEFPDPNLLEELRTRLLEPPDCVPVCAQIMQMHLQITAGDLRIDAEVHALDTVSIPLPASGSQWMPATVTVDDQAAANLYRTDKDELWLYLGKGKHSISLAGPLPQRRSIQLPLSLRPHRISVRSEGWLVDGIHENDIPAAQLQLTRISTEDQKAAQTLEAGGLPGFAQIERTLRIGLDWRVETQVVRTSPPDTAVVLAVPLLDGESVTTEDVRVASNRVLVNMPPRQSIMTWQSTLKKQPRLRLAAAATTEWTEVWRVDVSPVWHMNASGIAAVHHKDPAGRWLPEWRPWPGEAVDLTFTRPTGTGGQTLTVDRTHLSSRIGKRSSDNTLELGIRSSQGGQYEIQLPPDSELQSVNINGTSQPIRQTRESITLPLNPGSQSVSINWRSHTGIQTRISSADIALETPSVNNSINLTLGRDRWILFAGGPTMGPAVLFWDYLVVITLIAFGLGRLKFTPLTTRHWLLLGVGLSQLSALGALAIVGALVALGLRTYLSPMSSTAKFNFVQIGVALLVLLALYSLFEAIRRGLLGFPDMQIAGNGSTAYNFSWYQDHASNALPAAWLVSVPLLAYRVLMLVWALWIAYALLTWMKWGWSCYSTHGLWRPFRIFKRESYTKGATNNLPTRTLPKDAC